MYCSSSGLNRLLWFHHGASATMVNYQGNKLCRAINKFLELRKWAYVRLKEHTIEPIPYTLFLMASLRQCNVSSCALAIMSYSCSRMATVFPLFLLPDLRTRNVSPLDSCFNINALRAQYVKLGHHICVGISFYTQAKVC